MSGLSATSISPMLSPDISRAVAEVFSSASNPPAPGTYERMIRLAENLPKYNPAKHGAVADAKIVWQEELSVGGQQRVGRFAAMLFTANSHSVGLAFDFLGLVPEKKEVVNKAGLANFDCLKDRLPQVEPQRVVGRYYLKAGGAILIQEELLTQAMSVSMHRVLGASKVGPVELNLCRAPGMTSDDSRIVVEEKRWENHFQTGKTVKVGSIFSTKVTGSDSSASSPMKGKILRSRGVVAFYNLSGFDVIADFRGRPD